MCTLQAGAGERAVLAIPDSVASFEPGQESAGFTTDGLTEKASSWSLTFGVLCKSVLLCDNLHQNSFKF